MYKISCLDSLVVVPLGGEHDGAAVDLEAADPGEGAALVDELPVLVALAPLQDAVQRVRVLLHGGSIDSILDQFSGVCQGLYLFITLQVF